MRHKFTHACLMLWLLVTSIVISAQVPLGDITGKVVSEDGTPLAGMSILLRGQHQRSFNRFTHSDAEGNFIFKDLPHQSYRLQGLYTKSYYQDEAQQGERYTVGAQVTIRMLRGGIITGRVTDANGEPVVSQGVRAHRIKSLRDEIGNFGSIGYYTSSTDDRGVYRIFGLPPGQYVVSTLLGFFEFVPNRDVVSYHPSGSRAAATELTLSGSEEISGIDIRHEGTLGHTISGTVEDVKLTQAPEGTIAGHVNLLDANSGFLAQSILVSNNGNFILHGLADGDYYLVAQRREATNQPVKAASDPIQVRIAGADISGLKVKLRELAAISGQVVVKNSASACAKPNLEVYEVFPAMIRASQNPDILSLGVVGYDNSYDAAPDSKGVFTLHSLGAGAYHFMAKLNKNNWYLDALAWGSKDKATPPDVINLTWAEQKEKLIVTVTDGAASLSGQILSGKSPQKALRAYLVPTELARLNNVLRYAESKVVSGNFSFSCLAPGKYRLLILEEKDDSVRSRLLVKTDRDAIRQLAATSGKVVELSACQKLEKIEIPQTQFARLK